MTIGGSVWVHRLGHEQLKCFIVGTPLFPADSGTNLIEQCVCVCGGGCQRSVAQLAECSHSKREALGSRPSRSTVFSSPVTTGISVLEICV